MDEEDEIFTIERGDYTKGDVKNMIEPRFGIACPFENANYLVAPHRLSQRMCIP